MGFPRRFTEDADVATFVRALPAYAREEPSETLAAALIPRLADAARTPTADTREAPTAVLARRPLRRRTLALRVAVAVALIPALMAGLAVAGVKVPAAAQDAFEGVGIELPNQNDDGSAPAGETGDDGDAGDAAPTKAPAAGKGKARAKGKGNASKGGKGKALGHEKAPGQGGTPPGEALGQDKAKSNQGGGNGSSKSKGGGSGKVKKTPPGQAKKPKPTPPPQAKGKK